MSYASLQEEGIYSLNFLNSTSIFYFTFSPAYKGALQSHIWVCSETKKGLVSVGDQAFQTVQLWQPRQSSKFNSLYSNVFAESTLTILFKGICRGSEEEMGKLGVGQIQKEHHD